MTSSRMQRRSEVDQLDGDCCVGRWGGFRHDWPVKNAARSRTSVPSQSAFTGFRFPPDVIVLAVRWYLRYGLSFRDIEELLAERGSAVDHVTVYRWV